MSGVVFRVVGGVRALCDECNWGQGAGSYASRVLAREALEAHKAKEHPVPAEPSTPTTEQVRDSYAWVFGPGPEGKRRAEFDRWLDAHDDEVRADQQERDAQRVEALGGNGAVFVTDAAAAIRAGGDA